jgi:ATP-dependent Clp protease ATP-binding subunit ClpA
VFERFGPGAVSVVANAQQEARHLGHTWLGTEHLLLGVLAQPGTVAAGVLVDMGITITDVRTSLGALVAQGGFEVGDAEALRAVGIDLDQVRGAVEAAFGPGALDRPHVRHCRRRSLWRRRRRINDDAPAGRPFAPRAKRALERARREADRRHAAALEVEDLLFGLLDPDGNLAVDLVSRLGTDPAVVRARLGDRRNRAA